MSKTIVMIAGSPSVDSRSARLLEFAAAYLAQSRSLNVVSLNLRSLPAQALLHGLSRDEAIADSIQRVATAEAVIVATPVYKAAYSGLLKTFLDLLPQDGLKDKIVLPIATGGSAGHMLAIDYALKPVLSALGGTFVLRGVYAVDQQISYLADGATVLDEILETRLISSLSQLGDALLRDLNVPAQFLLPPHHPSGVVQELERC